MGQKLEEKSMQHSHLLRQIQLFESMEDADLEALGVKLSSRKFEEGGALLLISLVELR